MIAAIVLADQNPSGLETPLALLAMEEKTVLQHIMHALHMARVLDVVVVLGSEAEKIHPSLSWFEGTVLKNPLWDRGEQTSIVLGYDALDKNKVRGVLICKVSYPLLDQSLIVDVMECYWKNNASVVVPSYNGQRGYPVMLDCAMMNELKSASGIPDLQTFLVNHSQAVLELSMDTPGAIISINSQLDYETHIARNVV